MIYISNQIVNFNISKSDLSKIKRILSSEHCQFILDYKITGDVVCDFISSFSKFLDVKLKELERFENKRRLVNL